MQSLDLCVFACFVKNIDIKFAEKEMVHINKFMFLVLARQYIAGSMYVSNLD